MFLMLEKELRGRAFALMSVEDGLAVLVEMENVKLSKTLRLVVSHNADKMEGLVASLPDIDLCHVVLHCSSVLNNVIPILDAARPRANSVIDTLRQMDRKESNRVKEALALDPSAEFTWNSLFDTRMDQLAKAEAEVRSMGANALLDAKYEENKLRSELETASLEPADQSLVPRESDART